jgi:hexosaminidase
MLDTSRHFLPVSGIKQVMDLMAYLKMNSLRLHLIDETSWSYFVPDLPIISNSSAFSPLHVYYPDDLVELVAYGRLRGIVLWPEVDFPSHSQGLLRSIPEMGCVDPNGDRIYIDPTYPLLWSTMDKIYGVLNTIFPPQYPFHMGGDEVDRNEWATCPSVISWAASRGIAPGDIANGVTDWWYTSMYNWLASPPYNRVVMAWEDITDGVNASWLGATTGNLIIEQWNGDPGVWNSDTCEILRANASVVVAGPFHDVIGTPPSFNSNPEQNYYDIFNVSCPITPRVAQQLIGPELMFWDDAADISASDLVLMLMSSVVPVAESCWSSQNVTNTGRVNGARYQDMRCRLARRGMQSHDAYGHVGTYCLTEYEPLPVPWAHL